MKLDNILKENDGAMLTFKHLTSMQIAMLIKLADGNMSEETASPREEVVLDELMNYNLIDSFYELTPAGQKAAELGKKYGSMDRRRASTRDASLNRTSERDTNVDADMGDEMDDEMDDTNMSSGRMGSY